MLTPSYEAALGNKEKEHVHYRVELLLFSETRDLVALLGRFRLIFFFSFRERNALWVINAEAHAVCFVG